MAKKKIIPVTEQQLIEIVNNEGLGKGHPFETEVCMQFDDKEAKEYRKSQIPGSVGVARSGNDNGYICYIVAEDGRMVKISWHEEYETALGMAVRRYREFAKQPGFVKAEGNSFQYGKISSWRNSELSQTGPATETQKSEKEKISEELYERFGLVCFASARPDVTVKKVCFKAQPNWKRPTFYRYSVFLNVYFEDVYAGQGFEGYLSKKIAKKEDAVKEAINKVLEGKTVKIKTGNYETSDTEICFDSEEDVNPIKFILPVCEAVRSVIPKAV